MKTLKIGIAGYAQMKARTLAIARGKHKPSPGEPKIWFTSMESVAKVLSEKNQALLKLIAEVEPKSLAELETLTGRAKSNLSRTLHTMARYGIVRIDRGRGGAVIPHFPYSGIVVDVPISRGKPKAA